MQVEVTEEEDARSGSCFHVDLRKRRPLRAYAQTNRNTTTKNRQNLPIVAFADKSDMCTKEVGGVQKQSTNTLC